jgi:hypothetical protein
VVVMAAVVAMVAPREQHRIHESTLRRFPGGGCDLCCRRPRSEHAQFLALISGDRATAVALVPSRRCRSHWSTACRTRIDASHRGPPGAHSGVTLPRNQANPLGI